MDELERHIKETVAILEREPLKPSELRRAWAAIEVLEAMQDDWLGGYGDTGPVAWALRYLRAATEKAEEGYKK